MPKVIHEDIIIAKWKRNRQDEEIWVVLKRFSGRNVVELRTWWINEKGERRAGKDGLTVDISQTPILAKAFKKACKIARKRGLLEKK
jgi:hypothetical protein